MSRHTFTSSEVAQYRRDGYLLVRQLFDLEEIGKLLAFAENDPQLPAQAYGRRDAQGKETKLALWNYAGDDLYSMFARHPRIVGPMEQLLAGEVYLYHMKMMLKEPRVGGAWEWHQDYGYWYHNGCLYPQMGSCLIAVTPANRANGCLQVLQGSHKLGRIDHVRTGDQQGADVERVSAAVERLPLVYIEAEPGDALFFDGNLLHRSDANTSDEPRWSLITCYNAAANDPYKESRHPRYTPLSQVADDAIRTWPAAPTSV